MLTNITNQHWFALLVKFLGCLAHRLVTCKFATLISLRITSITTLSMKAKKGNQRDIKSYYIDIKSYSTQRLHIDMPCFLLP